ncbi:TRAFAC clade GTPase domain-containing protein [Corynebacterium mayonis]|uniref:TRAFAC clade GTPase domain-containing protein n=1 Tax=Corynebacterium mayonis TaxID=3062461 RepID=UPI0031404AA5
MAIPTRCPYTFKEIDPAATVSPYAKEKPLPEGWQNSGVITFAMAGARTSGKSVYIALVVKLLEHLSINYGGVFEPANESTRQSYNENYGVVLFGDENGEQRVLSPTSPADSPSAYQSVPLIFRLGRHKLETGEEQNIFVVFRDVAGEDLEADNFDANKHHLEFFKHADCVIYLYDPLAVPEIRSLLAGSVSINSVSEAEPVDVLKNVVRAIGDAHPSIALTLSKFDIMQKISELKLSSTSALSSSDGVNWSVVMKNQGAAFRRAGSGASEGYSAADSALVHEETRSMLMSLGAREMFNVLRQPAATDSSHEFRCFVVSSLGASPAGDTIDEIGIAPFRVLDPLRAQFYSLGLFA